MEIISKGDYKKYLIKMLDYITEFCNKNGLYYFLDGGSCLGAVRHKGFIPWDDDVDIALPRKDYEKLVELMGKMNDPNYLFMNYKFQDDFYFPFSKLIDKTTTLKEKGCKEIKNYGIFLDVFPIDFIPNDEKMRHKLFKKRRYYLRCLSSHYLEVPSSFKGKIWWLLLRPLKVIHPSTRKICDKLNAMCSPYACTDYMMDFVWAPKISQYFDANCVSERILCDFENKRYYIPCNYDSFLKSLYGDYMKLPPVEEQRQHLNIAYIK